MACSICGSDVHAWHGRHPFVRPPAIGGHEFAGVVAALGEGVSGLEVGLRAAVDGVIPCLECETCRRGLGNVCLNYRVTGFRFDGALAEYTKVPARNVHPLPTNLSFEQGALVQPLSIAYHGVCQRAKVAAGESVAHPGGRPHRPLLPGPGQESRGARDGARSAPRPPGCGQGPGRRDGSERRARGPRCRGGEVQRRSGFRQGDRSGRRRSGRHPSAGLLDRQTRRRDHRDRHLLTRPRDPSSARLQVERTGDPGPRRATLGPIRSASTCSRPGRYRWTR